MSETSSRNRLPTLETILPIVERYRPLLDDWSAFVEALQRPLPQCLWVNPLRSSGDELHGLLDEAGMQPQALGWLEGAFRVKNRVNLSDQWWYLIGLAHAQEEVSQVPVTLLDVQPGQRVLDMCAAPGGKTAQIAMALANQGTVVANDINTGRVRALSGNLERLGLVNVSTTRYDGATYPREAGQFDRILLDAPCTGEGTLRKNGTHTDRMGLSYSLAMAAKQKALLRRAIQLCKPGGRIVYSTCTFAPEENECVLDEVLRELPEQVCLLPARIDGLSSSAGITEWQGQTMLPELENTLRIWPQQNDTGGFFVAVLERTEVGEVLTEAVTQPASAEEMSWCEQLSEQYGFPAEMWQRFTIYRRKTQGLHLVAAGHQPPRRPSPEVSGVFFYRTNSRPPKLSTVAALVLGEYASRNRLVLDDAQCRAYFRRETFASTEAQREAVTPGHVIAYYRGHALGVAVYHGRSQEIESLFPRRWCGVG